MYCRNCGKEMDDQDSFCSKCGTRAVKIVTMSPLYKNPGLSAIMSAIIPGFGQIYNGQILKGIGFVIAGLIGIVLLPSSIILSEKIVVMLLYLALWTYSIMNAYKDAEEMNMRIK